MLVLDHSHDCLSGLKMGEGAGEEFEEEKEYHRNRNQEREGLGVRGMTVGTT